MGGGGKKNLEKMHGGMSIQPLEYTPLHQNDLLVFTVSLNLTKLKSLSLFNQATSVYFITFEHVFFPCKSVNIEIIFLRFKYITNIKGLNRYLDFNFLLYINRVLVPGNFAFLCIDCLKLKCKVLQ